MGPIPWLPPLYHEYVPTLDEQMQMPAGGEELAPLEREREGGLQDDDTDWQVDELDSDEEDDEDDEAATSAPAEASVVPDDPLSVDRIMPGRDSDADDWEQILLALPGSQQAASEPSQALDNNTSFDDTEGAMDPAEILIRQQLDIPDDVSLPDPFVDTWSDELRRTYLQFFENNPGLRKDIIFPRGSAHFFTELSDLERRRFVSVYNNDRELVDRGLVDASQDDFQYLTAKRGAAPRPARVMTPQQQAAREADRAKRADALQDKQRLAQQAADERKQLKEQRKAATDAAKLLKQQETLRKQQEQQERREELQAARRRSATPGRKRAREEDAALLGAEQQRVKSKEAEREWQMEMWTRAIATTPWGKHCAEIVPDRVETLDGKLDRAKPTFYDSLPVGLWNVLDRRIQSQRRASKTGHMYVYKESKGAGFYVQVPLLELAERLNVDSNGSFSRLHSGEDLDVAALVYAAYSVDPRLNTQRICNAWLLWMMDQGEAAVREWTSDPGVLSALDTVVSAHAPVRGRGRPSKQSRNGSPPPPFAAPAPRPAPVSPASSFREEDGLFMPPLLAAGAPAGTAPVRSSSNEGGADLDLDFLGDFLEDEGFDPESLGEGV